MTTNRTSSDVWQTFPLVLPDIDHLVTDDDTPMDSIYCEKQLRLLSEPLQNSCADWAGDRSSIAAANVGLFFVVKNPALVPDALLSMDVELPNDLLPKRNRSYFVWEFGKPPDVVVEVVSNREGGEDTHKLAAYARGRVPYYVIFDLDQQLSPEVLRGYCLDPMKYRRMAEPLDFPELGVGLRLWHGPYEGHDITWLRWVDARGIPIPTGHERAEAANQIAEAERQRAEAERQRAETERQRADRLAEQLRAHGIEPQAS